jgi:hypothetical protein
MHLSGNSENDIYTIRKNKQLSILAVCECNYLCRERYFKRLELALFKCDYVKVAIVCQCPPPGSVLYGDGHSHVAVTEAGDKYLLGFTEIRA